MKPLFDLKVNAIYGNNRWNSFSLHEQANFEGNKESLTAELVCLMDVNPEEQHVAQLKQYIEQFFISGASRIDLIGKIIDLDNEIGGYNFDIPLLEETENLLAGAKQSTGMIKAFSVTMKVNIILKVLHLETNN